MPTNGPSDLPAAGAEDHFATNLKLLREQARTSQEELAEKMSKRGFPFHQATIYKIENNQRRVQLSEALALADVFGVPVEKMSSELRSELVVVGQIRADLQEASQARDLATVSIQRFNTTVANLRQLLNSPEAPAAIEMLTADERDLMDRLLNASFTEMDSRTENPF